MSAQGADAPAPSPLGSRSAKLISCILPDDGTERRLLRWLRDQGITRANSVYCRGHSVLREAKARRGKLPEPELVRLVTIIVEADEADALFELIYAQADIHRPGGGALFMTPLTFATPFVLPEGVADENGARGE
jgi:hypothetical protein